MNGFNTKPKTDIGAQQNR